MDHRMVTGDAGLYGRLAGKCVSKLLQWEDKSVMVWLLELAWARHAKYGDTLFHLEPNIKDCPGGLRDVHVCGWMAKLREAAAREKKNGDGAGAVVSAEEGNEFRKAVEVLWVGRGVPHYPDWRAANTMGWER